MWILLGVAGAWAPRITIFVIYCVTDWLSRAYQTSLWPFLGFLFMPYTTLAYMGAKLAAPTGNMPGPWIALMVIAILVDLGSDSNEVSKKRRKS